ncbi:serine--tRNA ligase [Candidatus Saccharibacteria bacterium RIFCSPHIGHO2_02_FULL_47_12]|nr:MAG: serine--tRNA ligase [Candidatus Saccharibacteria bacterium RIFCSPHIGHO2_02_FULL_47_12]
MLDIQFIRKRPDEVAKKSKQKGYDVDIDFILQRDKSRRELQDEVQKLQQERNELAQSAKGKKPSAKDIERGKQIKEHIAEREAVLKKAETELNAKLKEVPNIFPDDTPLGDESKNREEKKWGKVAKSNFELKDHLTWAEERGLLDFEGGAKVAGNKFYYVLGDLVELEMALIQFGLSVAKKHGFTAALVPHLVNTRTIEGTGFLARGEEAQIYKTEDEDLHLIATAEIPLTGLHADEILDTQKLPIMYAGISPAYRREAGAYGKHSKGLYRVHQFNKLELYVFCKPEESEKIHQQLVAIEEEICQKLEIPYRLVRIAAGDLGAPAYKKYDVEYWSPIDKTYRELMSCSNVTDYQARRLNIRYRSEKGTEFVHTLNGTAVAASRTLIALIENHQQKDGNVKIPKVLQQFMGGKESI